MKRASVSELKASLSAYLVGVKNGEEILVTERGRPIARLVPPPGAGPASDPKNRLSEQEFIRLLEVFDEILPKIPVRPRAEVDREIGAIRAARRRGGRRLGKVSR